MGEKKSNTGAAAKGPENASQGTSGSGRLLRTAGTVGSWTMLSRVLGFVRDILLARVLGAGMLADAFFVAFKLPNFFRRMFAEGTLTVALVPVLAEERQHGEEAAHDFLNALAGLLLAALLVFTALGMIGMPLLLYIFAPGFHDEPDRWQQTLSLARWMFPYMAMISLCAMSWAVLNTYRRFAVAAASPALLNIALIFAAVVLAPSMENPAVALAIGVLLGGALQLGIQFPALKRIGWTPRPLWRIAHPALKRTLSLFGPAVVGVAAVQINILVGTILATLLPVGAVSYLYYSDRIVQLPLALFGIAMGTALLPALSEHFARAQHDEALRDLRLGLGWLTWITLPSMLGLLWLAEPIISTLFEQGKFTHLDSIHTAHALQAYAIGLIAFAWARVLSTACYAEKDSKTPMRYAAISVAVNIVLAAMLMWPFGFIGLALATSLAALVNVTLLLLHLRRRHGRILDADSFKRMLRAAIACVPMLAFLFGLDALWGFPSGNKLLQCGWLAVSVIGGLSTFMLCAQLFGESLIPRRRVKK
ncbi:MAG: murein biosynthesis integral membrane protein MurJ [Zetaproteobacteria bacterium CG06_land_8_20_14_3_00_59_53]|nr:MAG: murein biosynthesis integral membrane protein MurJ [Zetaproteobacteria bacterium CG23_combo_of_CG06-09_8_20_14_all_59_86]PIQ64490.1 MAG: murein biosynthesis integral membrane protein MurJ [Zetaproteobacteria bacterium CG11_big_fil_rev_8_21_14_0_20_59_439]PIU70917.1 MAG: murein biosynthesis integral membrane protein MurJ [Zetaproteobacteria bacterium CG06_land_8_20_14_3_00_59_53]PIU96356.1 MAG: murein biosynthesis integral membrane protein MurJ [Zetaproteobacteria bacterium CG03_land_8_20